MVEGKAAAYIRTEAQRGIFLAMATADPPAQVPYETRERARRMGIELPVPDTRLRSWQAPHAEKALDSPLRTPHEAGPNTLIVMENTIYASTANAEMLARAARNTPLEERLAAANPKLAGYAWYDALTRVTTMRLEGR